MWKKGAGLITAKRAKAKLSADAPDPQTLTRLGYAELAASDYGAACRHLDRAVEAGCVGDGRFWRTKGRAHICDYRASSGVRSDALEKARLSFDKALQHVENLALPEVLLDVARAYEYAGAWEGAAEFYSRVVLSFPRYDELPLVCLRALLVGLTFSSPPRRRYDELPSVCLRASGVLMRLGQLDECARYLQYAQVGHAALWCHVMPRH